MQNKWMVCDWVVAVVLGNLITTILIQLNNAVVVIVQIFLKRL